MRFRSISLLAFLAAAAAGADVGPASQTYNNPNGCEKYLMCNAQSADGDCVSGGDEIVLRSDGNSIFQFYSTQSTASAYTCTVQTSDAGHDGVSGNGAAISGAQLTASAEALGISGLFDALWINCTGITGGNVTVTAYACPYAMR